MTVAPPPATAARLHLHRMDAAQAGAIPALGGLAYGADAVPDALSALGLRSAHVPLLLGTAPQVDAWSGGRAVWSGQHEGWAWRHDGRWFYGALDIDEAAAGEPLAALTRRAYRALFETLSETGFAHPLRIWNAFARIHEPEEGLERYRQFNRGRQLAFGDAGRSAEQDAPAASVIGTAEGPLRIHVLAARERAVLLDNPRQVVPRLYPADYGPRAPLFARAALADAGGGELALLISGTASIVGHDTLHAGDVVAQTHETLANLRQLIAAAHAHGSARYALDQLLCTVFIRHAADAPAVRAALEQELGADAFLPRHALYVQADLCRSDLLVEIEAQAFAPGTLR